MEGEDNKLKGRQDNLYMAVWAWDFLAELVAEDTGYPKKGRGRIVEDLLRKEKSKRDKQKPVETQPAA